MKLVVRIASLSAIVLLLAVVNAVDIDPVPCTERVKLYQDKEFKDYLVPKSRTGKCYYECMLRNSRVVKDDGLINIQKFMRRFKLSQEAPKLTDEKLTTLEKILYSCEGHKHMSEDKCETTAFLLDCTSREAERYGWKQGSMLLILQAPYIYEMSKLHNTPSKKWDILFDE